LAAQLDLRAVLRSGGDLDGEALRTPLTARASTRRARRLDDRAHAAALRARLLQREKPLGGRDDAAAVAVRAGDGHRARCGAGSESTSYAPCASLNRSSLPGLRSGCTSRTSLRYAFLISSCDAVFETPSVS